MAREIYGPVNGARKKVTEIYGPVNGARKAVTKVYGSANGVAKLVWQKSPSGTPWGILSYYGAKTVQPGAIEENHIEIDANTGFNPTGFESWISNYGGGAYLVDFTKPIKLRLDWYPETPPVIGQPTLGTAWKITFTDLRVGGEVTTVAIDYQLFSAYLPLLWTTDSIDIDYDRPYIEISTRQATIIDYSNVTDYEIASESQYTNGYVMFSGYTITPGGSPILIPPERIKSFKFGYSATMLPQDFLGRSSVESLDFSDITITSYVGANFLMECKKFQYSGTIDLSQANLSGANMFLFGCDGFTGNVILPTTMNAFPNDFLSGCTSFNSPITLPTTCSSIGNGFLSGCSHFNQPITLPSNLTSIGDTFLSNTGFNQPITLPSTLTSIGNFFISNTGFDQPVTIPNSVTTIGTDFLANAYNFNSTLALSQTLNSVGDNFLKYCSKFNQPLTLPSSIKTVGTYFLGNCSNFNQPLDASNLTTIGAYFMYYCSKFNSALTLGSGLTSIPNYFMYYCSKFNQPLTLSSSIGTVGTYFMAGCSALDAAVTMSAVTSIGDRFMDNCNVMTAAPTLPSTLTKIGAYFMASCHALTYVEIPSTVTSIGNNFLRSLKNAPVVKVNTTAHPTDKNSLSAYNKSQAAYTTGVTIKGSQRATWLSALPDRTSSPYRKLVDGGA